MFSPDLLVSAARYGHPESIPVSVSILPAAWLKHGAELQRLIDEYPQFFGGEKFNYEHPEEMVPPQYRLGGYTDRWGCVWSNIDNGMDSIVTGHPIKSEEDVFNLQTPTQTDGDIPHGFMYLRLLDLCGFELAMTMFAEEDEAIDTLIAKVLEYNCRQFSFIADRIGGLAMFGDDLGMQRGLAIGPRRWRKYLAPCYKRLYDLIRAANPDTVIYMHTDGCIHEIMPDLVGCGVDMINPQFRANGLDNLVRVCRGKIPINLDLDRQLFPYATRSELFDHVGSCVEALYLPEGGLGLNCELNYEVPLDNMAALFDALEKYRFYK